MASVSDRTTVIARTFAALSRLYVESAKVFKVVSRRECETVPLSEALYQATKSAYEVATGRYSYEDDTEYAGHQATFKQALAKAQAHLTLVQTTELTPDYGYRTVPAPEALTTVRNLRATAWQAGCAVEKPLNDRCLPYLVAYGANARIDVYQRCLHDKMNNTYEQYDSSYGEAYWVEQASDCLAAVGLALHEAARLVRADD